MCTQKVSVDQRALEREEKREKEKEKEREGYLPPGVVEKRVPPGVDESLLTGMSTLPETRRIAGIGFEDAMSLLSK